MFIFKDPNLSKCGPRRKTCLEIELELSILCKKLGKVANFSHFKFLEIIFRFV